MRHKDFISIANPSGVKIAHVADVLAVNVFLHRVRKKTRAHPIKINNVMFI
jgi:hypothetical protein